MVEREPVEFGPASPDSLKRTMEFVQEKLGHQEQRRYFSETERSILTLHQKEGRYNIDHSLVHGRQVYRCRMVLTERGDITTGIVSSEMLTAGDASTFSPFVQYYGTKPMESDCRRIVGALGQALELPNFSELDRFTAHLRVVLLAKRPRVRRSPNPGTVDYLRHGQAVLPDGRVCTIHHREVYATETERMITTHCTADFVSPGVITEEIWGPTRLTTVRHFELRRTLTQPIDIQTATTSRSYYLEVKEGDKWHHRPIPLAKSQVCTKEAFWWLLDRLPTEVAG